VSKEKSTDKGKRYRRRASIEEVSTGSTKGNSGTASERGQREGKAPMVEENIQATHKTKEQLRQEEAGLEEAIKLQAQLDKEVAKQIHLDKMIAKRMAEEETQQQKKRKAQVQFEAQFYTEEDLDTIRAKLEANAELSKDVLGRDLPEQDFAKRMVDMVNQRKKHFAEERAKAKRNKPITHSQLRIYMSNYLKNQGTWKLSQLKKLKFEEIKEEFDKLVQRIDTFVPINLKATKAKLKRYGEELQTKTLKKQRIDDKYVLEIGEKVDEVKEEEQVKRTGKRKKQKARKCINVDKSAQEDSKLIKRSLEAMNPPSFVTTKSIVWQIGNILARSKEVFINNKKADTVYMSFGAMIKDFTREDLIELYRTMFDPPLIEDVIWSLPLQQKMVSWRYYDKCKIISQSFKWPIFRKDIKCQKSAGSDTRPPMLDRFDFASWQQHIRLYCMGKDNGENIIKSIDEGPFKMGKFRETLAKGEEGALHLGPERDRVFADLSIKEKDRFKADIRATNILFQVLPKDIYTLINHYIDAKDIWDNAKMLLEGSELTKDLNLMFVNNMLPEWGRFVTAVKLNRGLKEPTMISFQNGRVVVQNVQGRHNRGQGNYSRGLVASRNEGVQNKVGNANPECFKDKMLLTQAQENGVILDKEQLLFIAGGQTTFDDDVDEEPIQDLALNEDNIFQADQCDAFDSDVDEAPTAQTMFMANLSSTDQIYDEAGPSYDSDILSEVQDHDNYQDTVCEHHEVHEMHNDVQPYYVVDSDAEYASDSNMIPYDQYVKDNEEQVAAQCVSANEQHKVVNASLTAELARYKEQVELYERRAKFELSKREQKIDEQLRIIITDRNIKEENLKRELHFVKMQLNSTINHNKLMVEEVTTLKKNFQQKENKYLEEFLDMKALKEKVEDKLFKQD
ncbi:hypothetical protein Tco_0866179, partial [Tanacetum coccineum]